VPSWRRATGGLISVLRSLNTNTTTRGRSGSEIGWELFHAIIMRATAGATSGSSTSSMRTSTIGTSPEIPTGHSAA
jgi:hypothetical protein